LTVPEGRIFKTRSCPCGSCCS